MKPVVSTVQKLETTVASSPRHGRDIQNKVITENFNIYHVDEVFEAYITNATVDLANTDADTINLENKRTGQEKKESRAVLQELKSVLVSKQKEWKVRGGQVSRGQITVSMSLYLLWPLDCYLPGLVLRLTVDSCTIRQI